MMSLADTAAAFPWFFPLTAFLFGACIGSFLNVCIYRIPAERSIVRPGSHCACGQPVRWRDNIPILSWLCLRGRARCCGRPFSVRYPAIELLTASLFLICWLTFADSPGKAICGWVLISALIAGSFIDLDHMIIPDPFTIGLGVTGLALSFFVPALHDQDSGLFIVDSLRSGISAAVGMVVGSGLVLWIGLTAEAVLRKEAMGFGDVKLVGAIGAFTGWEGTLTAMFGGACVGVAWYAIAEAMKKFSRKTAPAATETTATAPAPSAFGVEVPFGPMIAIAGLAHFLWLHSWIDGYFAQHAVLFRS